MHQRRLALIALFVVNALYGINYIVAKGLMPQVIGASGFILVRVVGATILFGTLRLFAPERVAREDLLRLGLCAVFGVALNQLMFFHGLVLTSPAHASIIMVATPVLVLVMSGWLIEERITWNKLIGVALGASGALLLIFMRHAGDDGSSMLGDLFILINASSFGVYLVIVKPLMSKYSAVTVMAYTFLIGTVLVLPFGLSDVLAVQWHTITGVQWWAILFVVVMVTFVAYLLNTWALRYVNPSVVGSFIYLQPVLAMSITYFTTGALATGPVPWVSAAMIFTGVHLVNRSDRGPAAR